MNQRGKGQGGKGLGSGRNGMTGEGAGIRGTPEVFRAEMGVRTQCSKKTASGSRVQRGERGAD